MNMHSYIETVNVPAPCGHEMEIEVTRSNYEASYIRAMPQECNEGCMHPDMDEETSPTALAAIEKANTEPFWEKEYDND